MYDDSPLDCPNCGEFAFEYTYTDYKIDVMHYECFECGYEESH